MARCSARRTRRIVECRSFTDVEARQVNRVLSVSWVRMRSVACVERAVESAAAGGAMAAAAEVFGDPGDIDFPLLRMLRRNWLASANSRRKTAASTPAMLMR